MKNEDDSQVWNFVSEPNLHPIKVKVNVNKRGTQPGLIFVAPYTGNREETIAQPGSLIMDQAGNPVWFKPLKNRLIQNTDFKVQCYKGKPVLTMWEGSISGVQTNNANLPVGAPEPGAFFQIINQKYEVIKTVIAQKGYTADLHEFKITKRNTALFLAVKQVPADLSPFGGPGNGFIDNYSIQEVDLKTGELVFFWNVLDHLNPADSMLPASTAFVNNNIWDCFHINSIEEGPDNTLLINMRNMWAVYHIDKNTGDILWQLGGKQSDFILGPHASFSWQHDARFRGRNRISLFDNECCATPTSPPEGRARGLLLQLDFKSMKAVVDRTYYHDPPLIVGSQGNMQQLPNCNQFIGWGQEPYLSEFRKAGNTLKNPSKNLIYDMQYPDQYESYRAFKSNWKGRPGYPPSLTVVPLSKKTAEVYASWNGSTETAAWQVLAGSSINKLKIAGAQAPRSGFETKIKVNASGPYYQVKALDACGKIIGISQTIFVK
ncbi:arylsulfotransferase family protein [Fictibacillus fluitans]|uniref:Arylsulfotransferase family protein n=1 Tax=Fictibacillus fluitans TaxID=3058422 RepID=A0ABT8HS53_9BACL|nr:arylsulfotransferase family protein [Fictibacillus sp. NE201]MDN4523602.1 arylsulfotransferase family protein [Fictibacillus sp. NE201]